MSRLASITLVAALAWPMAALAQGTEIIRGRVFGPDSQPMAQVEVLVTGLATQLNRTARTDDKGVYTVLFTQPQGDYLVAVRKPGFVSTSFRLTRTGISSVLSADVHMQAIVMMLDTVKVAASQAPGTDRVSVGETSSGSLADVLFLADPSRLMELLLSMPGIYATDSGFSVGGASAGQNLTTLDGVAVRDRIGGMPPDAIMATRVITASSDPARGGFAGGVVSNTLRGGTDIFAATVRGTTTSPQMAWQDPAWQNAMPRRVQTSGTAGGPLTKKVAKYNISWNFNDSRQDWYTLLSPRPLLLEQRGISLDTIAAVSNAISALGVPLSRSDMPKNLINQNASMTSVLDLTPGATTSLRFSHNGSWSDNFGSGGNSFTSFPTNANQSGFYQHNVQARFSGYLKGFLNEGSISGQMYKDHRSPKLNLPAGVVRVGTEFADGRTGFSNLEFGGGQGAYYETTGSVTLSNEVSWLPKSGTHKVKFGGSYTVDVSKYYFFPGDQLLGRYTYLSTADLIANQPASYERLLNTSARNTRASTKSVWIGDEWTASRALQFQGGFRFDATNPITMPVYNPAADSVFGIRTDRIPNDLGITPRFGFSWASPKRRGRGTAGGSSTLGGLSASQVERMPAELVMSMMNVQRSSNLPGISINGSLSGYRASTGTFTFGELIETTGIASKVTLQCVGAEVPIPNWATMTEGPTSCAGGSGTTSFSIARPPIRVLDADYSGPIRWGGTLGVDGIRLPNKWIVGISGSASRNVRGSSTLDLNLNQTPQFNLASEGGRPVYVDATSIVPATGVASPGASRVSPDFGTVQNVVSDLSSYTTQLQVSVAPPTPIRSRINLQLSYSINAGASESRAGSRGGGTTGNPFTKEWIPMFEPRHRFRVNASARFWWLNVSISSFLQSGTPIVPSVVGDINGDGNSGNDRAFIPDPATTPDTSLARQMNDLLAVTPAASRRCLQSQFGRMAGLHACKTPWAVRADLSASITPPQSWGYNDRMRLTMNLNNASGGLVRLLKLEETPLGQATLSTQPQTQLLYVRGFDSTTQRFKYAVNQLFGQPTNFGSLRRRYAPTQLNVGFEYKFGGPPLNPMSRGLGLREPYNKPPLTDAERRAAVAKLRKDPIAPLLQRADSLQLTTEQRDSLTSLRVEYNAKADSASRKLTSWVTRKGQRIFDQDLSLRLAPAQAALTKLNTEYGKKAQAVLTETQLKVYTATSAPKK
jgi:hypothetical protein